MRLVALLIVCLSALSTTVSLSASSKYLKIGNFDIDAFCKHDAFLLDDGRVYKPISKRHKKNTKDWQLGDPILVMQKKHHNRYILVNTRTGEKTVMSVSAIEKCD